MGPEEAGEHQDEVLIVLSSNNPTTHSLPRPHWLSTLLSHPSHPLANLVYYMYVPLAEVGGDGLLGADLVVHEAEAVGGLGGQALHGVDPALPVGHAHLSHNVTGVQCRVLECLMDTWICYFEYWNEVSELWMSYLRAWMSGFECLNRVP